MLLALPAAHAGTLTPGEQCAEAAHDAERSAGLPAGLLLAIGDVESGRRNGGGVLLPWPWTLNIAGQARFFADAASAAAAVQEAQASGVRSIDAGCFQINLMYHPEAFGSVEQALDPAANAAFAARFLVSLRGGAGSWALAVARYHSMEATRGEVYRAQVAAYWRGDGSVLEPGEAEAAASDPFVVRVAGMLHAARLPVVWSYSSTESVARSRGGRLPHVIVPAPG